METSILIQASVQIKIMEQISIIVRVIFLALNGIFKPGFAVLLLGGGFFSSIVKAQNVTNFGYTSYTSVDAGTWNYGTASNPFTVTYSGDVWDRAKTLATYAPVYTPTALSNYVQPVNMLELGAFVNGVSSTALYTFTSALPTSTVMFIQDVDALESFEIQFLDASGVVLNPGLIGTYNLSDPAHSIVVISSTVLTVTATDNVNHGESLSDFIINSNLVKQVRITQIASRDNLSACGTAEFYFATAPINTSLPLHQISFNGQVQNSGVVLNWLTANEQNVKWHIIQKSSDAVNYIDIDTVAARNLSADTYSTLDVKPYTCKNYYRLRSVDIDGKQSLSGVVLIQNDCKKVNFILYPNPVSDQLNISGLKAGEQIQLYSTDGRLLVTQKVTASTQQLDMSKYARGIYEVIIINAAERVFTTKIIKY